VSCHVSKELLWSWIDRGAPELEDHLAHCAACRDLAKEYRSGMKAVAAGCGSGAIPMPEKIGSYSITGLLGEGGQALVYKAEQQTPRRPVALKVLKGGRCVGEQDVRHFQREIQTLAALSHPAIATIYEGGRTAEGQHFFAMELIDGVPLDVYVREHDLPLRERLNLFRKICAGVQYAHERGVIHRDLKPSNILVTAAGEPKILDFGLARLLNTEATLTRTGQIMGTLRYMSPEQARGGAAAIDVRTDVYSLGVILYELSTDRPPYELSALLPQAIHTICETPPRRPSSLRGSNGRPARHLRGDLETVVLTSLEKQAARRYQAVADLTADVGHFLAWEPIVARPPSGLYVLRKRLARHRIAVAAAGLLVALGLISAAGGLWRHAARESDARRTALFLQFDAEDGRAKYNLGQAEGLLAEHPSLPEAAMVLARTRFAVYRETGNPGMYDRAIGVLPAAGQALPSHWACRRLWAELVGDDNVRDQTERAAPDTADAWYLRTFATLRPEEAWRCAETAVLRAPSENLAPLVWTRVAQLSLVTRHFDVARSAARTLAALENNPLTWMLFEGHVLMRQGRYRDAIREYDQVTALFPNDPGSYRFRAECQLCLKAYEEAVREYTRAVNVVAGNRSFAIYLRATPRWITGRLEDAANDYRASRKSRVFAEYTNLRLFLVLQDQARQFEQNGRPAAAADCRREAQSLLAPESGSSPSEGWTDKLRECLAGRLSPEGLIGAAGGRLESLCEAYYYIGERCRLRGEIDQAHAWFARCRDTGLALDPDTFPPDPMNEYHLAVWRLDRLEDVDGSASQPAKKTVTSTRAAAEMPLPSSR
jgi:tetratricopeptide (TPR) repeat protein/predicted Ser/Thr protein kinase